jgi:hypothetical protein
MAQEDTPIVVDANYVPATASASGSSESTGAAVVGKGISAGGWVVGDLGWYDTITVRSPYATDLLGIGLHTFANTLQSTGLNNFAGYSNTLEVAEINESGSSSVVQLEQCEGTGPASNYCTTSSTPFAAIIVHPGEQLLHVSRTSFKATRWPRYTPWSPLSRIRCCSSSMMAGQLGAR